MSPDGKRHQRKAVSPVPLHPHPPPLQPSSRYSNLELLKALQLNLVVVYHRVGYFRHSLNATFNRWCDVHVWKCAAGRRCRDEIIIIISNN